MKQHDMADPAKPVTEAVSPPRRLYGHAHHLHTLEPYYSRHVSAMTSEGLHSKSDIAAELAFRDRCRSRLRAVLGDIASQARVCSNESPKNWSKEFAAIERMAEDVLGDQGGTDPEKPAVQP